MDRSGLQAAQTPLKERYRADPEAALVTLRADGELGDEEVACPVATGRALVEAGLHPATGGTGSLACSGDMLLQALAACAGVTLRAVATALGVKVAGGIHVEGDLDFRGTLGVATDENVPVGLQAIRLTGAGRTHVALRYRPPRFTGAAIVSAMSLAGALVVPVTGMVLERRARHGASRGG